MTPRFLFDDRHPSAVTETYMRIIREAVCEAGFFAQDRRLCKRPSRNDYIVTNEALVTVRYLLSGYRRHVVWMQGIVPEESYLRRHSRLRRAVLSFVERLVLKRADLLLLVSSEMLIHYETKYGLSLAGKSFIMPCFSETKPYAGAFAAKEEGTFAYVGSLSAWQCFADTAALYAEIERHAPCRTKFFVFTADTAGAGRLLTQSGAKNYEISHRGGDALLDALSSVRYGFVLRRGDSVNRIATPTKLSVYAACGLSPIYSPVLADFARRAVSLDYGIQVKLPFDLHDVSAVLRDMETAWDSRRMRDISCRLFADDYHAAGYRQTLGRRFLRLAGNPPAKRRILFIVGNTRTGGIPNAMYALLWEIHGLYDISLLAADGGADRERLPADISVLAPDDILRATETPLAGIGALSFPARIFRIFGAAFAKLFGKTVPFRLAALCRRGMLGEYDVAVSYTHPTEARSFCGIACELALFGCRASRRLAFIHCDFAAYGGNTAANRRLLRRFDRICAVSEGVAERFLSVLPREEETLSVVRNVIDAKRIFALAAEPVTDFPSDGRTKILSVCRLSPEKGLLRCIPIMRRLRDEGFAFSWHIVGDGPCRHAIESAAAELGLAGTVVLHGEKKNPYAYMARSDFLLLPSYHEAAPLVLEEACYLGLPILATDTASVGELTGGRAVVCGTDDAALAGALRQFLSEKIYEKLRCATDRASLLRLNAERTAASVRAFREACGEGHADDTCF